MLNDPVALQQDWKCVQLKQGSAEDPLFPEPASWWTRQRAMPFLQELEMQGEHNPLTCGLHVAGLKRKEICGLKKKTSLENNYI